MGMAESEEGNAHQWQSPSKGTGGRAPGMSLQHDRAEAEMWLQVPVQGI